MTDVLPEWLRFPTPLDPATLPAALAEPLDDGFRVIMPDDPAWEPPGPGSPEHGLAAPLRSLESGGAPAISVGARPGRATERPGTSILDTAAPVCFDGGMEATNTQPTKTNTAFGWSDLDERFAAAQAAYSAASPYDTDAKVAYNNEMDALTVESAARQAANSPETVAVYRKQYPSAEPGTFVVYTGEPWPGEFIEFGIHADNPERQWYIGARASIYRGRAISSQPNWQPLPFTSADVQGIEQAKARRAEVQAFAEQWLAAYLGQDLPTEVTITGFGYKPNV